MAKRVPIKGKIFNYHSDGTGRDYYIKHTNGGMYTSIELKPKENLQKMQFLTKSSEDIHRYTRLTLPPKLPAKTNRYWGDGTGRDYFVIKNDGGQSVPYHWYDNAEIQYKQSLRNYGPKEKGIPIKWDENMRRVQSALNLRQKEVTNKLAEPKKQQKVTRRPHTPNIKMAHKLYNSYYKK